LWARFASLLRLHDHTQLYTSYSVGFLLMSDQLGRDLQLTTHGIHNRQTSVSLAVFEPEIPEIKRPQTHALNRVATGFGSQLCVCVCVCIYIIQCYDCCCGRSLYLLEKLYIFLISNFFLVPNVVVCLLGESSVAELYVPTFRNTVSVPSS
jgi:hypothetical protein